MPSVIRSRSGRAGFTVIEILMVVAVVGVMMSIVVPRMRIAESTEVQLAGMQLGQDIDFARTRALSTRNSVRLVFTTGTSAAWTAYLDTDNNGTFSESVAERTALQGFGQRKLPPRVLFGRGTAPPHPGDVGSGPITFASNRVQFDQRGLVAPMGTSGSIYLRHEHKAGEVVAVALAGSGNVRIWTYHGGVWK